MSNVECADCKKEITLFESMPSCRDQRLLCQSCWPKDNTIYLRDRKNKWILKSVPEKLRDSNLYGHEHKLKSTFFVGISGSGKTTRAISIVLNHIDKIKSFQYLNVPEYFETLRRNISMEKNDIYGENREFTDDIYKLRQRICESHVVLLDDIHKHNSSQFTRDVLFTILNERYLGSSLITIFTSEVGVYDLFPKPPKGKHSDDERRIMGRIFEMCDKKVVKTKGIDYRAQK